MSNFLSDLFSLQGRVALVTGASSGIGRQMAVTLARAGAGVLCVARRRERLDALATSIASEGGRAKALPCDLSQLGAIATLTAMIPHDFEAPTILVNAAGINLREPPDAISWESWNRTLHLNLSIPFFLARALIPGMVALGGGAIINIASLQSFRAFSNGTAYGASKGGVAQLTRAMAEAWSSLGVRTNAISPGFFPTELTQAAFGDPSLVKKSAQATAIGRNGALNDLDGATIFLASSASAYVTGQILGVEGGYLAK